MEDFSALQSRVQSALLSTTRSAASLANEDLPFHRSLSTTLSSRLDRQNARLLSLASNLLGAATAPSESVRAAPHLRDLDSIDGNWRGVIDVVDSLLERADTALDEYTGAVRRLTPDVEVQNPASKSHRASKFGRHPTAHNIDKPQLTFEHVPTNRESGPFKPLLLTKPHATIPLDTEPVDVDGKKQYPHPYQSEIAQYQYPTSIYTRAEPIPYKPFESTSATFVDTEEALDEMLQELKQAKEVAIDLEHHDQRTYIGIVCLMQISTRDRDWIVDTLKPWRRKLQCLNEVFANPSILKVLHGAYMDIVWLQRDLGLYIVGLFDTHFAARALRYQGGSLAFLLKKFVDFDANKQLQLADWRQRPLTPDLIDYARSDTHYLLYIFDCMCNELIENSDATLPEGDGDLLATVLRKSNEIALQRYEHPVYDVELGQGSMGWHKLLFRTPAMFNKEQFAVFRAAHKWRDDVAREEDESVHFVMPNHQVFSIAREMPTNRAALLGLAQPTTQSVRLKADDLVSAIIKAKDLGKDGPTMVEVMAQIDARYPRSAPVRSEPSHSVAAFVPKDIFALRKPSASTLPLRSTSSAFWGPAMDGISNSRRQTIITGPVVSSLLMPPAAEIVESEPVELPIHAREAVDGITSSPAQEDEMRSSDEEEIVQGLGKKRKRGPHGKKSYPAETDGMAGQSNEVSLVDDEETERLRERAERKQAKREAKQASKLAAAAVTNGSTGVEAPFDYASAPSILKPAREEQGEAQARRKQANPYSKVLDVPKGAPRNPASKEKAGRSMTFQ